MACQIISNNPFILQSSVPPFFGAAFGFSQRLTAGPRPRELSRIKQTLPPLIFSLLFSMLLFDSYLLRFSTQHDPILDPMLALINHYFALLFPITFPTRFPTSFWTDFGPQIDVKIDQKSIKKFFQNQPTNKSYFSFIFNQISKTISCSSKMVDFRKSFQNLMFLNVF